jgi:hypothetical protein
MEVCRTFKGAEIDIRRTPGTQLINDRTGEVIFTVAGRRVTPA